MELQKDITDEFEGLWSEVNNDENNIELTENQLNETTNKYKLKDAEARLSHLAVIVNLYYHSKLGEPLLINTQFEEF